MNTRDVDVAVIESGSAGLNAFRQVEKDGGSPLLIEPGPYGTTWARVAGLRTALRDLAAKLKTTGECRCEDLAEAPGT